MWWCLVNNISQIATSSALVIASFIKLSGPFFVRISQCESGVNSPGTWEDPDFHQVFFSSSAFYLLTYVLTWLAESGWNLVKMDGIYKEHKVKVVRHPAEFRAGCIIIIITLHVRTYNMARYDGILESEFQWWKIQHKKENKKYSCGWISEKKGKIEREKVDQDFFYPAGCRPCHPACLHLLTYTLGWESYPGLGRLGWKIKEGFSLPEWVWLEKRRRRRRRREISDFYGKRKHYRPKSRHSTSR